MGAFSLWDIDKMPQASASFRNFARGTGKGDNPTQR